MAMAGQMQWFSVSCPSCALHLQAKLPEGITSVQCSECKGVFAVQIQPISVAPQPIKKSRKRSKIDKESNAAPRQLSAYNVFMKAEVAKVKGEHPALVHREAFKMAAERWQASPMNPQNGGERNPAGSAAISEDVNQQPATGDVNEESNTGDVNMEPFTGDDNEQPATGGATTEDQPAAPETSREAVAPADCQEL